MVPPNAGNTAVFFTWANEGDKPARLVGATSPAAGRVELHTHILEGGVAKMRKVEQFEVAAGETHRLEPGADHLMLLDLTGPIGPETTVDLVLSFADGSVKTWSVPAKAEP
jgi:hypothetical protein